MKWLQSLANQGSPVKRTNADSMLLMLKPQEQVIAPRSDAPPASSREPVDITENDSPQIGAPLAERLLAKGMAALSKMPRAERGTSHLINDVGELLREAGALFTEALDARRAKRDEPATLIAINNL